MNPTPPCQLHDVPVNETAFLPGEFEGSLDGPYTGGGYADIYWLNVIDPPRKAGTPIAIKCFRSKSDVEPQELVDMIANELKIWKILHHGNHPNVAPFLGVVASHEYHGFIQPYIPPSPVCEYYQNRDLDNFLRIHNPNPSNRLQLLAGVIRGLAHIHSLLVAHGDLKATNVLVDDTGNVTKICDFGSSRIECPCHRELENQSGTTQWDSPELSKGGARTTKSDIWAFGCLALEAQFGMVPYNPDWRIACWKMGEGQLPATQAPANLETPISSAVWDIMQRCWDFDPDVRPSAQAILAEFESLVESVDSQPVTGVLQDMTLSPN